MQGPEQSHSNHHNILDEASRKTAIRIADERPDEFAQVFKTCQKLIESFFPRISRKGREARRWAELFVFKFGVDSELKRWEVLLDPVIFILTKRLFVPLKAGEIDKKSFDFFLSRAHSDLFLIFQERL